MRKDFLCSHCKYGQFFRTVKSKEGIPYDTQYICVDKEKPYKPNEHNASNYPSILDYEAGPSGWDGETCPNFIEGKEPEPNFTITTSEGSTFEWPEKDTSTVNLTVNI